MTKTNLKFQKVIGNWCEPLAKIIKAPYFEKLMGFLNEQYACYTVYPPKKQVFRTFRETPYDKVRVVILGDPEIDELYQGIPFGCTENTLVYHPYTDTIEDRLEKDCGFRFNYDLTCKTWANQGVLMLGTRLTNRKMFRGAHRVEWRTFIRYVVSKLNEDKAGLIFCLWGEQASEYKDYINHDLHHVLECEHPDTAADAIREWKCDHFKRINEIIEDQNGEEFKIKWHK